MGTFDPSSEHLSDFDNIALKSDVRSLIHGFDIIGDPNKRLKNF